MPTAVAVAVPDTFEIEFEASPGNPFTRVYVERVDLNEVRDKLDADGFTWDAERCCHVDEDGEPLPESYLWDVARDIARGR